MAKRAIAPAGPAQMHRRFTILLIICLAGILLANCGPKTKYLPITQDSRFETRLERKIGKDNLPVDSGYHHPQALSPQEIQTLLDSIQIKYQPGFLERIFTRPDLAVQPAFSADEIQEMSGGLSEALGQATPADRVVFRLSHPRGLFSPRFTTGALYIKNDRLQFIIANYHATSALGPTGPLQTVDDPLSSKGGLIFKMVPGPFQEPIRSERAGLKDRGLEIDYRGLLAAPPPPVHPAEEDLGIEQKLKTLKRLRDQDLITEEEYLQKKKKLLGDF